MDVEGNSVIDNKKYVIKILMIGDSFNQLTMVESNEFRLTNVGIYDGFYSGLLMNGASIALSVGSIGEYQIISNRCSFTWSNANPALTLTGDNIFISDFTFEVEDDSVTAEFIDERFYIFCGDCSIPPCDNSPGKWIFEGDI